MSRENDRSTPKKYLPQMEFLRKEDEFGVYSVHYLATSQSKNPERNILKHFFLKQTRSDPGEKYSNFKSDILDSYLSRIFHKIVPHAPKGKIAGMNLYASRAYPFDSYTGDIGRMQNLTLHHIMKGKVPNSRQVPSVNTVTKLDGLLKSIVFNIITDNWDTKLDNIAAYPSDKVGVYKVAAFDLEYALSNNKEYNKRWTKEEIGSLVGGTHTESGQISVAEALAETIATVGSRTTDYYVSKQGTDPHKPKLWETPF